MIRHDRRLKATRRRTRLPELQALCDCRGMKSKKIHAINVNLFFRDGLDTDAYAKELKALHDAARTLSRVSLEQFGAEVEGQADVGEREDPTIIIFDGTLDSRGDGWIFRKRGEEVD